jgi:hypothetical protein
MIAIESTIVGNYDYRLSPAQTGQYGPLIVKTAAKVPAEIEVYSGSLHDWCVPDMPP